MAWNFRLSLMSCLAALGLWPLACTGDGAQQCTATGERCPSETSGSTDDGETDDPGTDDGLDDSTSMPGPTSSSGSTTSEPPPTCDSDNDCDDPSHVCSPAGQCVDCYEGVGTIGCEGDPTAPGLVCMNNTCVECVDGEVCGGENLCDPRTFECLPCTEHAQCDVGACELVGDDAGRCFPEHTFVVHVDDDEPPEGATEAYFESVQEAIDAVGSAVETDFGVIWIHPGSTGGSDAYAGPAGIGFDKTVAMFGIDNGAGTTPSIAVGGGVALGVSGGEQTTVYLADLGFTDSNVGLEVTDSTVHGTGVGLRDNGTHGLLAWGTATVSLERSRIIANGGDSDGGASRADVRLRQSSRLALVNSFVGSGVNGIAVVRAEDTAALSLSHSTVGAGFDAALALTCSGESTAEAMKSVLFVRGDGPSVDCAALMLVESATNDGVLGSQSVGVVDSGWFAAPNLGDFHLTATGAEAFAELTQWEAGDPAIDIDGDPRPRVEEGPDYPGADVPAR